MKFLANIIARLLEALAVGAIIELLAAIVLVWVLGSGDALTYLNNVFASGASYMDTSYFTGDIGRMLNVHVIAPLSHLLGRVSHYNSTASVLLAAMMLAISVFIQKYVIALVSMPIFFVFVFVGGFDGLIHRELRRYRVAVESVKREHFEHFVKWLTRFAFIGFVSIPLDIPAPLWFGLFGIASACLVQQGTSFIQKYI